MSSPFGTQFHTVGSKSRQAAPKATNAFATLAVGIALIMMLGAADAGLGGFVSAPSDLPDVDVETLVGFDYHTVLMNT